MANEDIKLTEFSHGAGCGCKISPKLLKEILGTKLESFVDAPIEETSDLPESEEIEEKRIEDIADLSVRHEEVSEMEEDVELDLDELKKEINKNVDDTLSKYFK